MEIKGSQSEKNLMTAFMRESGTRNLYDFFSGRAKKEKLIEIHDLFMETSEQDRALAKRLYKLLQGGDIEVSSTFPSSELGETKSNLETAISIEHYEWETLYPSFAETAREEGFKPLAKIFESIAIAEKYHEAQFIKLLKGVETGDMFQSNGIVIWRCRKCGYLHAAKAPPGVCPACDHPKGYFDLLETADNGVFTDILEMKI